MSDLKLKLNPKGDIHRIDDGKHVAHVDLETGDVTYSNPAYAKGAYRKTITKIAALAMTSDGIEKPQKAEPEKASKDEPPKDPQLGRSSPAWVNFDHANLSDEAFARKYKNNAQSKLELIARRPELFTDIEALEERLASL